MFYLTPRATRTGSFEMRTLSITSGILAGALLLLGSTGVCLGGDEPDDPNMTKFGRKLSAEELASIAELSVPELTEMLRNGDTMHAYAALDQLRANGGWKTNFDLLLSIAGERGGDMIVEGFFRKSVSRSASDEDKRRLDKFLDFLESQLAKDKPSVSRSQALRSIAQTVYLGPANRDKWYARHGKGPVGATRPADRPAKPELPYAYERVMDILTKSVNHQDWQARKAAIHYLYLVGRADSSRIDDIVALLEARLAAEETSEEEERIKTIMRRILQDSLRDLNKHRARGANRSMQMQAK